MSPSFLTVGAAVLAAAASAVTAHSSYHVHDVYDSTNFFDKWNFYAVGCRLEQDLTPSLVLFEVISP